MTAGRFVAKDGKWLTDSDGINQDTLHKIIFVNKDIDNFLFFEGKYFVCAGKGEGKTMLLQQKRTLLSKQYAGACFIPSDKPYMVVAKQFGDISLDTIRYYKGLDKCKKIWSTAISISVISYHSESHQSSSIFNDIFEYLGVGVNEKVLPTDIIEILFEKGISSSEKFINKYSNPITRLFRNNVQSGTLMFIDRIDQALEDYKDKDNSKDFWVNMQVGLLEAAWDIKRDNNHVKIYTSVRQEAYFNYVSGNKNAMSGEITFIKYDDKELNIILDKLSLHYEGKKSFTDFIGFKTIHNNFSNDEEDSFHYMYRHTVGRPRDLVQICSELSSYRAISKENYRKVINYEAGKIVENYFEEQSIFLNSVGSKDERNKILALINSNMLTLVELKNICARFNGIDCHDGSITSSHKHPFCELYNIGLLGVIIENKNEGKYFQSFLEPRKRNKTAKCTLPESPFYLIHPSLETAIQKSKPQHNSKYEYIPSIAVGNGMEWVTENNSRIKLIKLMRDNPEIIAMDEDIKLFLEKKVMKKAMGDKTVFMDEIGKSIKVAFAKKIASETVDKVIITLGSVISAYTTS